MDQQTLIFELSSDEEIGFDNSSSADNFDWIKKLLEDVVPNDDENRKNSDFGALDNDNINVNYKVVDNINGGNKVDDDDDEDVVVVGEVIAKPKRAKGSFLTDNNGCSCDGDDDDCVILDCDPDKKPSETCPANDDPKDCEEDEDELVVVGGKGQVACRDFPHSRHLCANFPFSSTEHASRCDQCHCYVCDTLAPCAYWGSGILSSDHCHATDKVENWQLERKRIRELKNPPLPTVSQSPQLLQATAGPNLHPEIGSTCGVSLPSGITNIINQGRNQRIRNRYQHLVSNQILRTCSGNIQGNRGSYVSPRGVQSRLMFKRPGLIGRSELASRPACCSPNEVYLRRQNQQIAKPVESNSANLRDSSQGLVMNSSTHQLNTSSTSRETLPLHLQGSYGLPSPHTPTSRFQGGGQSAAVMSYHPYKDSSVNQTESVINPLIPCNTSSALNPLVPRNVSSALNPLVSCNVSNALNGFSHRSQQLTVTQVHNPNITQRRLQPFVATPNWSSTLNQCGASNVTNSFVQIGQQSVPMNSLDQAAVPMSKPLPPLEQELSLDFDVDSWLAETDPEKAFSGMNSQPALTDPVDAGVAYFDFETSWKGLTHL